MFPSLQPGDEVLVDRRAYLGSAPSLEDVVVVLSPHRPQMRLIKRVVSIDERGNCFVQGDNQAQSTDSPTFGWVAPQLILGSVTSRFL